MYFRLILMNNQVSYLGVKTMMMQAFQDRFEIITKFLNILDLNKKYYY